MSADWTETTLGAIANKVNGAVDGPFGSNLKASSYRESGIPVIRGSNLSVGIERFNSSEFVYVNEATLERLKRSECLPGDIIFTKKGTLGQTGIIPADATHSKYLLSSNQMRLRVNTEIADPEYVYYCVSSQESISKIRQDSEFTGVPKINLDYLKKFPIRLPCLTEQKFISKILRSLDRKIELNAQTNQTLESIAQAIFKSWFVDFEPVKAKMAAKERWYAMQPTSESASPVCYADEAALPDLETYTNLAAMCAISGKSEIELAQLQQQNPDQYQQLAETAALFPSAIVDSELGEIPEGWAVRTLSDLINIIGGGTPNRSIAEYWNGDIPWFSIKDLPNSSDIFVIDTDERITELGLKKSSTKLLPENTTIITARGTVGKLALIDKPMCMNQSCYGITGADGIGPLFNYFNLKEAISTLQRNTHGAVFDTITTKTFESYSSAFCGKSLADRFDQSARQLLDKIKCNLYQIRTLSDLRDSLLPKLLSGEIDLTKIENEVT